MTLLTLFATANDSATAPVRFWRQFKKLSLNFDYGLKLTGQAIPTYYIVENMSGGSVNMRDSGFSFNKHVKQYKKIYLILTCRWFLTNSK